LALFFLELFEFLIPAKATSSLLFASASVAAMLLGGFDSSELEGSSSV